MGKLLLLIVYFINLFSPGGVTCRAVSGSSNYCDSSICYLYSNSSGQVGETLTFCATQNRYYHRGH